MPYTCMICKRKVGDKHLHGPMNFSGRPIGVLIEDPIDMEEEMYTVQTEFHFCAAHRLPGHAKCGRLHGHNYRVEVSITMKDLPTSGMVIDFGTLKGVGELIIDQIDHKYIVSRENIENIDPYYGAAIPNHCVTPDILRSTAECLSKWLWDMFAGDIQIARPDMKTFTLEITTWETHKSKASFVNVVANTEMHGK